MCQASKAHLRWRHGWLSITDALAKSMSWLVFSASSAMADELGGPEVRALLCSLRQCSKVRPVWPVYTSRHDAQGTWYTTPGFCSSGIGSFGCTNSCLNVRCDLKQVRISRGVRILRIDSETYVKHMGVLQWLWVCLLCQGWEVFW